MSDKKKLTSDSAVDDVHSCLAHVVLGSAGARLGAVSDHLANGTDVAVVVFVVFIGSRKKECLGKHLPDARSRSTACNRSALGVLCVP